MQDLLGNEGQWRHAVVEPLRGHLVGPLRGILGVLGWMRMGVVVLLHPVLLWMDGLGWLAHGRIFCRARGDEMVGI